MNRTRLLAVMLALVLAVGTVNYAHSSGSKSYSSGGGKSYSSGGASRSVSSGGSRSYSSSGGKSYSSGNTSYSSAGSSKPSVSVALKPVSGTGNKTYSSNTSYSVGNKQYTAVSPSGSSKPKSGAFDGTAAAAQKRVESKANYLKGPEPQPTYTSPTGQTVPINPATNTVQQIRSMDRNVYITRETRIYSAYSPYYSRPLVLYNDPYNSFFWWWMLDRSLDERAMWAYSHRYDMDSARYQALLAQDARLETRIRQLEAEKAARDPNYLPAGIDADLQYTDDYVHAVYNPHAESRVPANGLWTVLWIFAGGAVLFAVIYLVFFHNWQFAGKEP
jgi:hypothetical protein